MIYLLVALAGAALALLLHKQLSILVMQRRFARGRRAEVEAETFLDDKGFAILERQPRRVVPIWVDGRRQEYEVRADFLVAKRWRTYVAEVKSGKKATNPTARATRRQLLEYGQVYDADGLLLVDMNDRKLHRIRFAASARGRGRLSVAFATIVLGFAGGLAAHDWTVRTLAALLP